MISSMLWGLYQTVNRVTKAFKEICSPRCFESVFFIFNLIGFRLSRLIMTSVTIGPFEFKVEGRSKTAGTAEGCDFWDQNGVLLLHLRVQQQRKSKINEFTMSDGIE